MCKIIKNYIFAILFLFIFCQRIFAAKYTIAPGIEFNTRIKKSLNMDNDSNTAEYSIKGFEYSSSVKGNAIDISEDGDASVLAYIDSDIIYYVADDDIYLNEDASYMFDKFVNIRDIDLTFLNFSKTKKMNFMFSNCKYLSNVDMDNDTVIRLNEMMGMFFDCQSIKDLNLYMIDTKNVKNMSYLFYNCKNLRNININPKLWSTLSANKFTNMYYNCFSLNTNFNRSVIDIDESKYKLYSRAGNDNIEGLLRDFDYEYDNIITKVKKQSVNKNDYLSADYGNNENPSVNEDSSSYEKFFNVVISSDSTLFNNRSDDRISTDGKMDTKKYLNSDTLDDIPILKSETTFVDELIPQKKEITRETNDAFLTNNENADNSIEIDEDIIDFDISQVDSFNINDFYPIIIVSIIILFVLGGVIYSNIRNKKDEFNLWG